MISTRSTRNESYIFIIIFHFHFYKQVPSPVPKIKTPISWPLFGKENQKKKCQTHLETAD